MQMLAALLGSLKGLFGRTYLFAGLLPAALLLFGYDWATEGPLTVVLADGHKLPRQVAQSSLQLLALALVFYALHPQLLYVYQAVPGSGLFSVLRKTMTTRQLKRKTELEKQVVALEWRRTAIKWGMDGFAPAPPESFVPEWETRRSRDEAIRSSTSARRSVLERRSHSWPLPDDHELTEIVAGLQGLLTATRSDKADEYLAETELWRGMVSDYRVKEVLSAIDRHLYREWSSSKRRLVDFPTDDQWLQPTSLGNRIEALNDYAERRYGISTSTLWTRLWGTLADSERQPVSEAQLDLHMMVNLSAASALVAASVALRALPESLAAVKSGSAQLNLRALLFTLGAVLLFRIFYQGSLSAFQVVAEQVIRLTDLKRRPFIEAMGFSLPPSLASERELFCELNNFFGDGMAPPRPWYYRVEKQKTESKNSEDGN